MDATLKVTLPAQFPQQFQPPHPQGTQSQHSPSGGRKRKIDDVALSGKRSLMLNSTTSMTLMGTLYCREALRSFVVVGANWHRAVRTTLRYFEALSLRYSVFCVMLTFFYNAVSFSPIIPHDCTLRFLNLVLGCYRRRILRVNLSWVCILTTGSTVMLCCHDPFAWLRSVH